MLAKSSVVRRTSSAPSLLVLGRVRRVGAGAGPGASRFSVVMEQDSTNSNTSSNSGRGMVAVHKQTHHRTIDSRQQGAHVPRASGSGRVRPVESAYVVEPEVVVEYADEEEAEEARPGLLLTIPGPVTPPAPLTVADINQKVVEAQYAVRGAIVIKAEQVAKELAEGVPKPFDKVVFCNIGNPQSLGQKPITFFRQVLSICDYPELLENPAIVATYPTDVIDRAKMLLSSIKGGTGAYSESKGAKICRDQIVQFLERRDGYPSDPNRIFMTDGASPAVHYCMKMFIRDENDAILTPIPQYPLYSATITLYGGSLLPYYLMEDKGWGLDVEQLRVTVREARAQGKNVRALVIINPGNPTGQALPRDNQEEVVKFCHEEGIMLLADEVYQENVYAEGKSFTSFKKVVRDMNMPDTFPVISFHSISKGFYGECGRRGGYMEVCGLSDDVVDQFYKLASVGLCSNLNGQICMSLITNPPQPGEPSYDLYTQERNEILASLKRRSIKLVGALNALENVTCNMAEGAMYAFPCLDIPAKACEAAKAEGTTPDTFYALRLLDATGIVVVPGAGFGQKAGTYHFRTTFLPSEEDIDNVVVRMTDFHAKFMNDFR